MEEFKKIFGDEYGTRMFFAPGRVNLIGEHTDYNGGHVFPCALNFGTYAAARKRKDKTVRLYSDNLPERGVVEFSVDEDIRRNEADWANYPKGVIYILKQNGFEINEGFEALFHGDVPNGAGLSSSASIELVTSVMMKELFNLNIDMLGMVRLSQRAENQFVGVNCGIMDQFASGMGKKDCAVLLDCSTLKYRYSRIDLKEASLIIANTNKRRGLADSKYNERRNQCERALLNLKKKLNINSLGELTEKDFERNKHLIENEIDRKRAKHAVYENQRTLKAVKALEDGNLNLFGELMNESHISLRDDYEVTGKELDTLVELAWQQEGTIGSRMTGAGFGGCTVSIVKNNSLEEFIKKVGEGYSKKTDYKASFYTASIGDGAREINMDKKQ